MSENQKIRLLQYLKKNKSITPLEAWTELGIYRLSDTIFKLRNDGHYIKTEQQTSYNKFDEKVKFAKYVYKEYVPLDN
jgi:hypothetical protein